MIHMTLSVEVDWGEVIDVTNFVTKDLNDNIAILVEPQLIVIRTILLVKLSYVHLLEKVLTLYKKTLCSLNNVERCK
jgi:hypothetical protein